MAVTAQKSLQVGNADLGIKTPAYIAKGQMFCLRSSPPVGDYGIGDANSTIALVKVPAGRYTLIGFLSKVCHSAFGTARTMDIGWDAYTKEDGTPVAADEDGIHSAADVSAAGSFVPLDELGVSQSKVFDSREGVTIRAKVEAGAILTGETVDAFFVFQE